MEQPCPKCQSLTLHRSRARTIAERVRRNFSVQRLFRCTTCDWRGWLLPLQFSDVDAAEAASAPNLAALDAAVQSLRPPMRPTFAPRDLH
jgi:hypothetical protein